MKPFLFGLVLLLALFEALGVAYTNLPNRSPDFRTFYAGGYLLRTDRAHLYDMDTQARVENQLVSPQQLQLYFNHPPYEALVDAPFTLLPFKAAYRAFMALNVLAMMVCVLVARKPLSRVLPLVNMLPGFAFFFFVPIFYVLLLGQDSILFLLCACLCWRELDEGRDLRGGIALALALFRFQLAIPLAVVLAARRGWRFAAGFVAAGTGVVALCAALVGVSGLRALVRLIQLTSGMSSSALVRAIIMEPRGMPNLRGMAYACLSRWVSPHTGFVLVAIASLLVLLACIAWVRRARDLDTAFAIATLAAVLVSYHLFFHDATLMLLPLLLLSGRVPNWLLVTTYLTFSLTPFTLGTSWIWIGVLPTLALTLAAGLSARRNSAPAAPAGPCAEDRTSQAPAC